MIWIIQLITIFIINELIPDFLAFALLFLIYGMNNSLM